MAKKQQNKKKQPQTIMLRFNFMWIWGIIILSIIGYSLFGNESAAPLKSNTNDITKLISQGEVERIVVINKSDAKVYLTDEAIERHNKEAETSKKALLPKEGEQYFFTIGSVELLDQAVKDAVAASEVENNPVSIEYLEKRSRWDNFLVNILPWIFIIAIWIFIFRGMARGGGGGGNIMNVGKARAQVFDKDNPDKRVTFRLIQVLLPVVFQANAQKRGYLHHL